MSKLYLKAVIRRKKKRYIKAKPDITALICFLSVYLTGFSSGSDEYNLVVNNNKGISKVVKVDEEPYRNYQAGANVKFRIDKNASNEVVLDLNKEKDIKSEKEFKKKFENKLDSWFDDWRDKKSS